MADLRDVGPGDRYRGLWYGPYGSGKTITAHGAPYTRTLDFDDGMSSINWALREGIITKPRQEIIFETVQETERGSYGFVRKASALDQACDIVDMWLEGKVWNREEQDWVPTAIPFETLIVDSASGLTEATTNKALPTNKSLGISKSMENSVEQNVRITRVQDWGTSRVYFNQFIDWLMTLDKNLIVIAHEFTEMSESGDSVLRSLPALMGQDRTQLGKKFSEVYYFHTTGSKTSLTYNIQTVPDSRHVCKSRLGCLDPVIPASYSAIVERVAEYYDLDPETLWIKR